MGWTRGRGGADNRNQDSDLSEFFLASKTAGTQPIRGLAIPTSILRRRGRADMLLVRRSRRVVE